MKNKIILMFIVYIFLLTGCFKNKDKTTEPITNNTTNETENNQNSKQEDKTNISIFTKDLEIEYEKTLSNNAYFEPILNEYFINKLKEDTLLQLNNNENIRIQFKEDLPKDKKVSISKIYIEQDSQDNISLIIEDKEEFSNITDDGYLDIKYNYNNTDKENYVAIGYEIIASWEDVFARYIFGFKLNNDNKDTLNNNSQNITGYLSSEEQKIYDKYKEDKNIDVFKNVEPKTITKYYVQALTEEEYSLAYTFYQVQNIKNEQQYLDLMNNKEFRDSYLLELKGATSGEFVKESEDRGYIKYEIEQGHTKAIDFVKENDIWKISYLPVQ